MIFEIIISIAMILASLAIYEWYESLNCFRKLNGRHVLITGGTKGIGYEMAKICVQNGSNVTVLARNQADLQRVQRELESLCSSNHHKQSIQCCSVDLADPNVAKLEQIIENVDRQSGPIDLLICCAGNAIARTFNDCSIEDFHRMMNVNYFGTVNTIKTCLKSLKKQTNPNDNSRIMIFSSIAGVFGLYGYAAYSASKFALIGLAETLDMELKPHNISVTVSFPPDTDTPGYKNEQIGKPRITELISGKAGLFKPLDVARKSLKDFLMNQFISTIGFDGFIITTLCSGMMPCRSLFRAFVQVLSMSTLRGIGLYFLYSCEKIVQQNYRETIGQSLPMPMSSSESSKSK